MPTSGSIVSFNQSSLFMLTKNLFLIHFQQVIINPFPEDIVGVSKFIYHQSMV